jgi:hypothetical protein
MGRRMADLLWTGNRITLPFGIRGANVANWGVAIITRRGLEDPNRQAMAHLAVSASVHNAALNFSF